MRRIKKFRIPVYGNEILRRTRNKKALEEAGLESGRGLMEHVSLLASYLEPALTFETAEPAELSLFGLGSDGINPATAAALTLGKNYGVKADGENNPALKVLNLTASSVFINTAVKLASELAQRDADLENCAVLAPAYIYKYPPDNSLSDDYGADDSALLYETKSLRDICLRLETDKIGISCENYSVEPKYSAIFFLPWQSKGGRRKKK